MSHEVLVVGINSLVCGGIFFTCICRIGILDGKVKRGVKLRVGGQYIMLLLAAAWLGAAPWRWESLGWSVVVFASVILYILLTDIPYWRHGPPYWLRKGFVPPTEEEIEKMNTTIVGELEELKK